MENARPGNERPNAIEAETPYENRFVSIMSEDPIGMAKRGERVCTVIECQQFLITSLKPQHTQSTPPEDQMILL